MHGAASKGVVRCRLRWYTLRFERYYVVGSHTRHCIVELDWMHRLLFVIFLFISAVTPSPEWDLRGFVDACCVSGMETTTNGGILLARWCTTDFCWGRSWYKAAGRKDDVMLYFCACSCSCWLGHARTGWQRRNVLCDVRYISCCVMTDRMLLLFSELVEVLFQWSRRWKMLADDGVGGPGTAMTS